MILLNSLMSTSLRHVFFVELVSLRKPCRLSCVGTSLLPVEEHALADWEGIVQSRTKEKLEKLQKDSAPKSCFGELGDFSNLPKSYLFMEILMAVIHHLHVEIYHDFVANLPLARSSPKRLQTASGFL